MQSGTLSVGYLPQEADVRDGETLLGYLARRTGVLEAEHELDSLAGRLEREPELAEPYAEALNRFLALGGEDFASRARAVSRALGLPHERLAEPATALSGGEAARAALAAILLARFDVLLLDEPTNDLDFAGLELLERFLADAPAGVVLVSHDRTLLATQVDRIVELTPGSAGAREYAGGFAEYERGRDLARRREYETWSGSRRSGGASKSRRAAAPSGSSAPARSGGRRRRVTSAASCVARSTAWTPSRSRSSRGSSASACAATLAAATSWRGSRTRWSSAGRSASGLSTWCWVWQDRLAVLGPNGSGKTTLLRALLGDLPLAAGTRSIGSGVVLGELEQGRQAFATAEPLLQTYLRTVDTTDEAEARTALAKFGLGAGHVSRPGASLSPGERTRAALASFMARGANLLVLDEPTNHLDLPAIEQLEAALESFDGTAVVVSHDRRFLERFAATRTLELPGEPNPGGLLRSRENPLAPARTRA